LEEIFDSLEDINESVLACTNIYSCLREKYYDGTREGMKYTHGEKDSDSCKDNFPGRENLESRCERNLRPVHSLRHTGLTPSPRVFDNKYNTFTVGSSHFVRVSSSSRD
jgi:hypothetical protein